MKHDEVTTLLHAAAEWCGVLTVIPQNRALPYVRARQIAAHLLYHRCGLTLCEIGCRLRRHHSTVADAIRRAQGYLDTEQAFREDYDAIALKALAGLRTHAEQPA